MYFSSKPGQCFLRSVNLLSGCSVGNLWALTAWQARVLSSEPSLEINMRSIPCKNLSKLVRYLFIFCFKDNTFRAKRWHEEAVGCINIESFYFFLVNRYSTIFDYIRKHRFQCIHSSDRQEHGRQTFHSVIFFRSQATGFSQFSLAALTTQGLRKKELSSKEVAQGYEAGPWDTAQCTPR